jgi:hypothetical protein
MCSLAQSNYWSHTERSEPLLCLSLKEGEHWSKSVVAAVSESNQVHATRGANGGVAVSPCLSPAADLRRRQAPLGQVGEEKGAAVGGEDTAVRPVHFHWICHFLPLSPLPSSSSMYIPVLAIAQDSKGFSSILKYSRAAGLMMQQLNWRSPKIRWNRRWLCTESAN